MNVNNASFRITLELEAQSPLIHFQAREPGATLRPSEVKPKLDRFLLAKLEKKLGKTKEMLFRDKDYMDFFLPAPDGRVVCSLAYRMRITCRQPPTLVVLNNDRSLTKDNPAYRELPNYSIYYANSGVKEPEVQRLGVLSQPTVEIRCFVPALRALLREYLEEFFLVTNFGTMQSKGFGSFAPKGFQLDEEQISRYLTERTGTDICLLMPIRPSRDPNDFSEHFKWIERFCRLMKSGYNMSSRGECEPSFLFDYMHGKYNSGLALNNEKAWMKERGISPVVYTSIQPPRQQRSQQPARYVRCFLGATGSITYKARPDGGRKTVTITSGELARVPSPLSFKILGNTVFITTFPVDASLYGKPYRFEGYGSGTLFTPETSDFPDDAFDIAAFLRSYTEHYNELIRSNKLPRYLKNAPLVKEVQQR